ncbi:MAG: hypothetical protein BRD24_05620 [Halobacteriales archaeon SW_9_67_24]|nr:MAG: hypothetical protein BRD24_05620 [Halobacteriales archaeon SW_9_67_24]
MVSVRSVVRLASAVSVVSAVVVSVVGRPSVGVLSLVPIAPPVVVPPVVVAVVVPPSLPPLPPVQPATNATVTAVAVPRNRRRFTVDTFYHICICLVLVLPFRKGCSSRVASAPTTCTVLWFRFEHPI